MRYRRWLAGTALLAACVAAHAEHFQYRVNLSGIYSDGGTDGCYPPFDQPACPRSGTLSGLVSFDTPSNADGSYVIAGNGGDVTNFSVSLGSLPYEDLFGGVDLSNGTPNGSVQDLYQTELFIFNWGDRTASYTYDYGYHSANGNFSGTLSAIPEPGVLVLLLSGLAGMAGVGRRRVGRRA